MTKSRGNGERLTVAFHNVVTLLIIRHHLTNSFLQTPHMHLQMTVVPLSRYVFLKEKKQERRPVLQIFRLS